jgi:hypothetical protein
VIIGAKGANIEKIGSRLQKVAKKKIQIKIKEIKKPETNAQLIAENVARQLVMRGSFRRSLKMAVNNAIKAGAQGLRSRLPEGWAARKWLGQNGTRKVGFPSIPSDPTSITVSRKRSPHSALSASRYGSSAASCTGMTGRMTPVFS